MLHKLRKSSQLRLLSAFGLSAAGMISAFGVYRFFDGELLAALSDALIAVIICLPVAYALISGNILRSGIALCLLNTLCCMVACFTVGPIAAYWSYLVLITNFFFAPAKLAAASNLVLTVAMLTLLSPQVETVAAASLGVSALLITLFTYFSTISLDVDRGALEKIASLDSLTGLANRRTMELCLTEALHMHRSQGINYGLIILDIDHFKRVNDTLGHPAGDALLAELSANLKNEMRKKDRAFRFGGEEFVVLSEIGHDSDLRAATERIRQAIVRSLTAAGAPITLSAGAALLGQEDNWQDWFSLADAALYRAKCQGRDQTVESRDSSHPAVAATAVYKT